ncbi:hypothetical protein ACFFUQ_06240 [Flavobacterium branchiarum]|uniref:Carboxypeptidase-like protein n=2 Tax=Flavobacterium branchiarum TaxID=1114870 RepID=A0ABV5FJH4_9FLAO
MFLFFAKTHSQQVSKISGYVLFDSIPLEKVIVKNISRNNYTLTDNNGFFYINSNIGDTLTISYLGMKPVTKIIGNNETMSSYERIYMEENSIKLKEIIIDNNPKINAVSLGIIPNERKKLSPNERKLKTAGDFKPIHLLSILGGQLKIDPILNAINGRTKQLKKNIQVEKKEKMLNYLRLNYHNYIVENLKLSNEEISQFYYYVIELEGTEENINSNNDLKIKFFLSNALFEFKN